jgi:N-methylhydantoinase A
VNEASIASIRARFEEEHRRLYGFIAEHDPIQLVTFRVGATGWSPRPPSAVIPMPVPMPPAPSLASATCGCPRQAASPPAPFMTAPG